MYDCVSAVDAQPFIQEDFMTSPSSKKLDKRSDEDIVNFITELPGGNPTQYSKLMGVGTARISKILKSKMGSHLVRKNMVRVSESGTVPMWATEKTQRGCLRAVDLEDMYRDDCLPHFIQQMLEKVHPNYRGDALNFFRDALENTANKITFEHQMQRSVSMASHYINEVVATNDLLRIKSQELLRIETLLDRSMTANTKALEHISVTEDSE